jgi:hypothetical protein
MLSWFAPNLCQRITRVSIYMMHKFERKGEYYSVFEVRKYIGQCVKWDTMEQGPCGVPNVPFWKKGSPMPSPQRAPEKFARIPLRGLDYKV